MDSKLILLFKILYELDSKIKITEADSFESFQNDEWMLNEGYSYEEIAEIKRETRGLTEKYLKDLKEKRSVVKTRLNEISLTWNDDYNIFIEEQEKRLHK